MCVFNIRASSSSPRQPLCQILFLSRPANADLAHGEKSRTNLHSLFDAAENQARTSAIYNTISVITARTDLHHTERLPVLVQLTKRLLPGHRPPLMKYSLQAESPFSTSVTQTSCHLQCVSHKNIEIC